MSDKTIVLITGANTGLGYEIVRALCSSPRAYEIILGGRSLAKADLAAESARKEYSNTTSTISTVQIDIEEDNSIEELYNTVERTWGRVDTLINNAGALFDPCLSRGEMTMRQMWNKSWNTNVVGTQVMTQTFLPLLLKSADPRLIFMTSGTSSLAFTEDPTMPTNRAPEKGWPKNHKSVQGNLPAYRSVKTGMNMMMREWNRILQNDGVKVWAVSPGFLATNLSGDPESLAKLGAIDPSIGGHFVKDVVEGKRDADVGKAILKERVQPW